MEPQLRVNLKKKIIAQNPIKSRVKMPLKTNKVNLISFVSGVVSSDSLKSKIGWMMEDGKASSKKTNPINDAKF